MDVKTPALTRTSATHPINISWLFPHDLLASLPSSADLLDRIRPADKRSVFLGRPLSFAHEPFPSADSPLPTSLSTVAPASLQVTDCLAREEVEEVEAGIRPNNGILLDDNLANDVVFAEKKPVLVPVSAAVTVGLSKSLTLKHGNFALSSCPGKKVRLNTGPVNGRAVINRDLDQDFDRLQSFGITLVVNCLDDKELDFLGAAWPSYIAAATRHNLTVVRLPMVEGSSPNTVADVNVVLALIDERIQSGKNVLCHCRGGN
ncbi:hypothetical protein HK096_006735 [Nowakowskiella sp. JEL0078]|nr:hypothetical protein HK096_006735 [Nowakowskiella sp. JEL0078]